MVLIKCDKSKGRFAWQIVNLDMTLSSGRNEKCCRKYVGYIIIIITIIIIIYCN